MICNNCGYDIPENENICPNCGCDCNESVADGSARSTAEETRANLLPEKDWRKEEESDDFNATEAEDEDKHVYPTVCQRGSDEGIPDIDLGKSTRYITKKRSEAAPKTKREKIALMFRPPKDSPPFTALGAAQRNALLSVFLDVLAFASFLAGFFWALEPPSTSILLILFCIAGVFISLLSIDCADNASDYYKKFYKTELKRCKVLSFIARAMFWVDAFMSAVVVLYKLLLMTGFLQAAGNRFIIW